MKHSALMAAATLALLMPSLLVAAQKDAQDVLMPEVVVTGEVADRPHPQDGNYSDRPLGCVEVVTPSGTGNAHGGFFFARFAPSSVSVMPSLNHPYSANETKPEQTGKEHQPIPPGATSPPRCR